MSEVKQMLYCSIIDFLHSELSVSNYSEDAIEALEVAKQCLESAFKISEDSQRPKESLLSMFERSCHSVTVSDNCSQPDDVVMEASSEDKAVADILKLQGNHCMSEKLFQDAISCYSRAIELNGRSAVYYCNRAAAYGRLNNHDESIKDCEHAISIDPSYSKAYGRMGLAYSSKGNFQKAIECYKKAISLDPNNANFQLNLAVAETRLSESAPIAAGGLPVDFDLRAVLSNPTTQNLVQRLMADPNLQNTMASMMQGLFGDASDGAPAAAAATDTTMPTDGNADTHIGSMDNLLRFGQQFATQMQQSNPELVNNLRQHMRSSTNQPSQPPTSNQQADSD